MFNVFFFFREQLGLYMDLTLISPFFKVLLSFCMACIAQLLDNLLLFFILEFFPVILGEVVHHAVSIISDFLFTFLQQIKDPPFLKFYFIKFKPFLALNVEFFHALLLFPRGGVKNLVRVGILRT